MTFTSCHGMGSSKGLLPLGMCYPCPGTGVTYVPSLNTHPTICAPLWVTPPVVARPLLGRNNAAHAPIPQMPHSRRHLFLHHHAFRSIELLARRRNRSL